MNRKLTWHEKMILDGVDSVTGPGGLPEPVEETSVEDNDNASE